ncbi:MAG: SDR family NAD(P)-dependent oxidoreductase [Pseudomonadota bacterium]|nr:SDR family NAD(P)-dependent oxidoreductase [Pseudomonadota bacterium]
MGHSVLIVGASRGIGLGLVEIFASHDWEVHATVRDDLGRERVSGVSKDVFIHRLDVRDRRMATQLVEKLQGRTLDILLHNAGVYGNNMQESEVLQINSVAPFQVVAAFLHLVIQSTQKKIAILTSQMGARNGGETPSDIYGKSKCVLNDKFRRLEPEWRTFGATSIVVHPGWVATDMGGASAPVSVAESAAGIYKTLENLKASDSGCFLTWEGNQHPW